MERMRTSLSWNTEKLSKIEQDCREFRSSLQFFENKFQEKFGSANFDRYNFQGGKPHQEPTDSKKSHQEKHYEPNNRKEKIQHSNQTFHAAEEYHGLAVSFEELKSQYLSLQANLANIEATFNQTLQENAFPQLQKKVAAIETIFNTTVLESNYFPKAVYPTGKLTHTPGTPPANVFDYDSTQIQDKYYSVITHSEYGDIPGKAKGKNSWFSWGGKEHETKNFSYLEGKFKLISNIGMKPIPAAPLGRQKDDHLSYYPCIAHTKYGAIPGKARIDICYYPLDKLEHLTQEFDWVSYE